MQDMSEKGPITGFKISRMDPMESYDVNQLREQLIQHIKTADALKTDAHAFLSRARLEEKKSEELESLIKQVEQRDRERAQDGKSQ